MRKTKKTILPKTRLMFVVAGVLVLVGLIFLARPDFSKLSTSLVTRHYFSLAVPSSKNSSNGTFSFSVGLVNLNARSRGNLGALSIVLSGLPSSVKSCTATTSISGWKASSGNLSGGKVKMLAIGSRYPTNTNSSNIISVSCSSGNVPIAPNTSIKIKGEATIHTDSNVYVLGEKSIAIKEGLLR